MKKEIEVTTESVVVICDDKKQPIAMIRQFPVNGRHVVFFRTEEMGMEEVKELVEQVSGSQKQNDTSTGKGTK